MTVMSISIVTAVASILVAAVSVLLLLAALGALLHALRKRAYRRSFHAEDLVEADYQTARRAMNDAAGQSWRNLID